VYWFIVFSPREREGREKLWCPHSYTHGVISFFSHDAETTFFWRIRFCLPSAHTRHTCTLLCSFCGTPLRQSVQSVRRLCACCVVFRCLHVPPKRGALQSKPISYDVRAARLAREWGWGGGAINPCTVSASDPSIHPSIHHRLLSYLVRAAFVSRSVGLSVSLLSVCVSVCLSVRRDTSSKTDGRCCVDDDTGSPHDVAERDA